MSRTLRFHLDEHVPTAIADGLKRRGIDVTTTLGIGLVGVTDEEQAAYALAEGRVIFTQDQDFLRLHAAGLPHAGIAYCHQRKQSLGRILAGLIQIWETMEPEEMQNTLVYL
jgi:predicted nuclease of predicted toxin-antitoxin system